MSRDELRGRLPMSLIAAIGIAGLLNAAFGFCWLSNCPLPADLVATIAGTDHRVFDRQDQFEIGLVTVEAVAGTALYGALFLSWLRRWQASVPLALVVGSVQCYAVLITLWCGLLDGRPNLDRTVEVVVLAVAGIWFALHLLLGISTAQRLRRVGAAGGWQVMEARDRWVLSLTIFYVGVALSIELPWLLASGQLARIGGWFGAFWGFYGRADRGYFDLVSSFERGIESFHIFVTQWLHIWLICAILKHWACRYLLQLIVASYVAFSTAVYLAAKHMTGYPRMPEHSPGAYAILYLANLPWLLGNAWIAYEGERGLLALPAPEPAR